MNEEEKKKFNIFLKVISLSILGGFLVVNGGIVAIFDYVNETVLISNFIDKFVLFIGGIVAGGYIFYDKIPNLLKEVDYYERPVNNNSSKEEEKLERNLEEDLGKTITLEELVGLEEPIPDVDYPVEGIKGRNNSQTLKRKR